MKRICAICGLYLIGLIIGVIVATERFLPQESAVLTWVCMAQMIWSGPAILWALHQLGEEGKLETKMKYNLSEAVYACIFILGIGVSINLFLAFLAIDKLQSGSSSIAANVFLMHTTLQLTPIVSIFVLDRIASRFCKQT